MKASHYNSAVRQKVSIYSLVITLEQTVLFALSAICAKFILAAVASVPCNIIKYLSCGI